MRREDIILETSLGRLLEAYADHCRRNGLREGSVQLYWKLAQRFLKGLEDAGVTGAADIGPHEVSCACLALKSNYYLSAIHTFLRFLAEEGYTQRDYSCIVPLFKRPQPMPRYIRKQRSGGLRRRWTDKGHTERGIMPHCCWRPVWGFGAVTLPP